MELINLLNNENWEESVPVLQQEEISKMTRKKVLSNVKKLYRSYINGLVLNLVFASVFSMFYVFNQSIEFLIPVLLICSCFLFIVINLVTQLIRSGHIDNSGDLLTVLTKVLKRNKRIYRVQCNYNSVILSVSFVAGFMLGLAVQGWTFEKYLDKPVIFPILLVLLVIFRMLTKSKNFDKLNRILNPGYYKSKKYLENQLAVLTEEK